MGLSRQRGDDADGHFPERLVAAEILEHAAIYRQAPGDEAPSTARVHRIEYLGKGMSSLVFLAELWDEEESPHLPRAIYVTIKMARLQGISEHHLVTPCGTSHSSLRREVRVRERLGLLTGITDPPELWALDLKQVSSSWVPRGYALRGTSGDVLDLLVTRLRGVGRGGPAPTTLRMLLPRRGVWLARHCTNWFEVARTLANALLVLHGRGCVHGDVKADNVIIQEGGGYLYGILLADFGSAHALRAVDRARKYPGTLFYYRPDHPLLSGLAESSAIARPSGADSDLFAMGLTLVEMLLGADQIKAALSTAQRAAEGEQPQRRPYEVARRYSQGLLALAELGAKEEDELRSRAFNLVLGCLLEPPGKRNTLLRLKRFLEELDRVRNSFRASRLYRRTVRKADHPAPSLRASSEDPLLAGLTSLRWTWRAEDRKRWCAAYVAHALPEYHEIAIRHGGRVDRDLPEGAELHELARRVLKEGYGHVARPLYARALEQGLHAENLDPERRLRALITYGGVLLAREEDAGAGMELLHQFGKRPGIEGVWGRLLRRKLQHHLGERLHSPLRFEPSPEAREEGRLLRWEYVTWALGRLADPGGHRLDLATEDKNMQAFLASGTTNWEFAAGTLIRARMLAREPDQSAVQEVLASLLSTGGLARTRHLPHEYLATLVVTAELFAKFLEDGKGAEVLWELGSDPRRCLPVAADCALDAAEMYASLGLRRRCTRALRLAARCLVASGAPDGLGRAMRWTSLSRNLALHWGFPPIPRADVEALIPVWHRSWSRYLPRRQREDPGHTLRTRFEGELSAGIDQMWGAGGPFRLDMPGPPGQANTLKILMKAAGLALQGNALRVLMLGCGDGEDALTLASAGHIVIGVESSPSRIRRIHERFAATSDATMELHNEALTSARLRLVAGGGYDLVIARDILLHYSAKQEILSWIREILVPDGRLIMTDWVQVGPGKPWQWWGLTRPFPFTDWETPAGYLEMLGQARLRPVWTADWTGPLSDALKARRERSNSRAGDAKDGAAPAPSSTREIYAGHRFRQTMDWLVQLAEGGGPLGWWACVAAPTPLEQKNTESVQIARHDSSS